MIGNKWDGEYPGFCFRQSFIFADYPASAGNLPAARERHKACLSLLPVGIATVNVAIYRVSSYLAFSPLPSPQ